MNWQTRSPKIVREGTATHLSAGLLSPGIDWLAFMREGARLEVTPETFSPPGQRAGRSRSEQCA